MPAYELERSRLRRVALTGEAFQMVARSKSRRRATSYFGDSIKPMASGQDESFAARRLEAPIVVSRFESLTESPAAPMLPFPFSFECDKRRRLPGLLTAVTTVVVYRYVMVAGRLDRPLSPRLGQANRASRAVIAPTSSLVGAFSYELLTIVTL